MTSPLVSVVIPTHNRAHSLFHAIGSVLAQTYSPIEIVVVDDGSTDDTRERIHRAHAGDGRVRYVYQQNAGPSSARNTGFRHVRGEYVALLDSDDTWWPWKLSLQIRCMERYPHLLMTWTDMEMIGADGQVLNPAYLRTFFHAYRWFTTEELFPESLPLAAIAPELAAVGEARLRMGNIFSKMILGNLVATSSTVLRREALARVKGFDESLQGSGEDYDFHLRTCREGPVGLLDLPAGRYQQGMPDRLTARRWKIHMARNLLRTIEPVIARDRPAIDLPDSLLRRRLAEAHAWTAYEYLQLGDRGAARRHYIQSLGHWPWQPRLLRQLLLAALPNSVSRLLRQSFQALRSRSRNSKEL